MRIDLRDVLAFGGLALMVGCAAAASLLAAGAVLGAGLFILGVWVVR